MNEPLVSTIEFSPAKATLSDVMNEVFHRHRPYLVSRHHGKEQMLLVRPEDLVAMIGDQPFDARAVYDEGEVTLSIPGMGVLGVGETLDEASRDLLDNLRAYVARYFQDPPRDMATSRREHAGALLRFALASEDGQRSMLGFAEPEPQRELISSAR